MNQDLLTQLRLNNGQRTAGYPDVQLMYENLRKNIYGNDTVTPNLRATRDAAISQLWDVDKRLADRYANPQSNMFIQDPYAREKLAAGQHQSVLNSVSQNERLVQAREDMLGNLLDKSLELLKLQLSQNQANATPSIADLLALSGQNQQTQARTPTGNDLFRARILSGEDTSPKTPPENTYSLWDRFTNLLSRGTGGLIPPSPGSVQGQITYPQTPTNPDILQAILTNPPGTSSSQLVMPSQETNNINNVLSTLGLNQNQLAYLDQFPDQREKVVNDIINQTLFPDQGGEQSDITAPANRDALNKVLEKVQTFQTGVDDAGNPLPNDYTAIKFYNDVVAANPELDADSIRKLLASLGMVELNY
jgi:hypothetical protein